MTDYDTSFPPSFYTALEQFNAGEYFECHETLEELWIPEQRPIRDVYQGILHVAVACYHLTARQNWTGAVNQLAKGLRRLEPWPDRIGGIHLGQLKAEAARLREHLAEIGPDRVTDFEPTLLPVIAYDTEEERS